MTTVLLTVAVFALSALGLGLGVALGRAPVSGSCGGTACRKDLGLDCEGGCDKGEDHG